mmetsp:Transcript_9301/g.38146  ORF Transcript_9301/g.38146 Transcript_9301/m.38146 type:complete len:789 (-) Transcript_9301:838-3204(-)
MNSTLGTILPLQPVSNDRVDRILGCSDVGVEGVDLGQAVRGEPIDAREVQSIEEGSVVRDDEDGALVVIERRDDLLERFVVEVIRRLVEDEGIDFREREAREDGPRARPGVELGDGAVDLSEREAVANDARARLEQREARHVGDVLPRGPVPRERLVLLHQIADFEVAAESRRALDRVDGARQRAEQRALADAVLADDRDALAEIDAQRHGRAVDEDVVVVPEHDVGHRDGGVAARSEHRVVQVDPERRTVDDAFDGILEQFRVAERLDRLGLLPRAARAIALEVALHHVVVLGLVPLARLGRVAQLVGDVRQTLLPVLLRVVRSALLLPRERLVPAERRVARRRGRQRLVLGIYGPDARRDDVAERRVVAHEDDGLAALNEGLFEPHYGFDVQMVCRLVEQQEVDIASRERERDVRAQRAPRRQPPDRRLAVDPRPRGEAVPLGRDAEPAPGLEVLERRRRARGGREVQSVVHRQVSEVVLGQVGHLEEPRPLERVLLDEQDRRRAAGRLVLLCRRREAPREAAGAEEEVVVLRPLGEGAQQRRLATAVGADQSDALPREEMHPRNAIEQLARPDRERQVRELEQHRQVVCWSLVFPMIRRCASAVRGSFSAGGRTFFDCNPPTNPRAWWRNRSGSRTWHGRGGRGHHGGPEDASEGARVTGAEPTQCRWHDRSLPPSPEPRLLIFTSADPTPRPRGPRRRRRTRRRAWALAVDVVAGHWPADRDLWRHPARRRPRRRRRPENQTRGRRAFPRARGARRPSRPRRPRRRDQSRDGRRPRHSARRRGT